MADKAALLGEVDLIGSAEAAELLDTTTVTLWRWSRTGYVPAVRHGTGSGRPGWLYDRAVILAVVERRRRGYALLAEAEQLLGGRVPTRGPRPEPGNVVGS